MKGGVKACFSQIGVGVGHRRRDIPKSHRCNVNLRTQAVVWKRNGWVVYQSIVQELGGLIISVTAAIKGYGTASVLEAAGQINFAQTDTQSVLQEGMFVPYLSNVNTASGAGVAVHTKIAADRVVIYSGRFRPGAFRMHIHAAPFDPKQPLEVAEKFKIVAARITSRPAVRAEPAMHIVLINLGNAQS